jgi:hypothetical protein
MREGLKSWNIRGGGDSTVQYLSMPVSLSIIIYTLSTWNFQQLTYCSQKYWKIHNTQIWNWKVKIYSNSSDIVNTIHKQIKETHTTIDIFLPLAIVMFLLKTGQWKMSKKSIIVLIFHRHKLLDFEETHVFSLFKENHHRNEMFHQTLSFIGETLPPLSLIQNMKIFMVPTSVIRWSSPYNQRTCCSPWPRASCYVQK